jgi:hypothetical protein
VVHEWLRGPWLKGAELHAVWPHVLGQLLDPTHLGATRQVGARRAIL